MSIPSPIRSRVRRNYAARYAAALCGVVALVLFFLPWVDASLVGIGDVPLTGLELARGEAAARVDTAVFGPGGAMAGASRQGAGTDAAGASTGGLVLPTRIPTVAPGLGGAGTGGLVLPTRIPTVAPGQSGGLSAPAPTSAEATPSPPLPEAPRPEASLPRFLLYLVPLAALGIAAISATWDRYSDPGDRNFGKAWTLLFSVGGTLGVGSVLYRVATAPAKNALIGPGVGGVTAAEPALWGVFLAFLFSAVCLSVAWLSPAPPPPDPYWRARAPA